MFFFHRKKRTKNSSPKKLAPLKQFLDGLTRLDVDPKVLTIVGRTYTNIGLSKFISIAISLRDC